ncbi:hypothetical protein QFZ31_001218 [Neobacillus niacini]|nr:hypothetical protein [Neobacillus niacini]MDQ0971340.1 hypothetical protein [Neobacillus niacini]
MNNNDCNFSPLKQQLEDGIQFLIQLLQSNLNVLEMKTIVYWEV